MKAKKWRIARINVDGGRGWGLYTPDGSLFGATYDSWGWPWEMVLSVFADQICDWGPDQ